NHCLYQAFINGVGLQLPQLPADTNEAEALETMGRHFREVVKGLMALLQSRSELKSEFRMSATTIRPTENNPLKFSPNVDEALKTLVLNDRTGFLDSETALIEAIEDIQNHQIAMI